ncbi:hypothetical protein E9531_12740 [Lampropedia puyangensis]|uniref:DUF3352 domain-containing protein n=1 Tax=Lampropedia puyangensis TaxID=1330072 RepID=A0A4S8EYB5_9BURK|nr:hypothetical protein [Lampropedia puyangensis]THT99260.1 hypothetical protein E9531_12740 [Lampropedia puyangensis]
MRHIAKPTALVLALALAGCANLNGQGGKTQSPLAYAPADSAFVFGNLSAPPKEYAELNTRWFNQLRDGFVQSLKRAQEISDEAIEDSDTQKRTDALLSVLEEKLSQPEGWSAIGININARMALYEVNALPVLRLELGDKQRFEAFMAEAEQKAGVPFGKSEINGQAFWHAITPVNAEQILSPRFVAAVVGNHLVLTADAQRADTPLIAQLGVDKPKQSALDSGALDTINKQYGFQSGMASGYIDLQRVLQRITDKEHTLPWITNALEENDITLDATCTAELQSIVAKAPRIVAGGTELVKPDLKFNAIWELEPTLAKELTALPAPVQGLDASQRGQMVMGASLNLNAAAAFLQKQAASIVTQPYQCEGLTPLNDLAAEAHKGVAGLYSVANWVQGIRLNFSKLDINGQDFAGTLLVASPNPSGLIGMVQGFVPELAKLGLVPGGPAKQLEGETTASMTGDDKSIWAIMGDKAVAIGVGEESKTELEHIIKATAPAVAPLMYFGFAGEALVQFMDQITEEDIMDSASSEWEQWYNYVTWPLSAGSVELYKEIAYTDMQWLATERGLEFPQTIVLKPLPPKAP